MKKINKKGFTLTQLIVVIVIIGILAAVLIPTLTGYITKAKETAAKQETSSYVTAFNTWQIEDEKFTLASFREYCVELGLANKEDVSEKILYTKVDEVEKTFVIKADNNLFVLYKNGEFKTSEEDLTPDSSESDLIKEKENFYKEQIKNNIPEINSLFPNNEAKLTEGNINYDGSIVIDIELYDLDAVLTDTVVAPVIKAMDYIKAANGKYVYATPILNGKEYSIEEYKEIVTTLLGSDAANTYFPLEINDTTTVGTWIAFTLSYNTNIESKDEWTTASTNLYSGSLEALKGLQVKCEAQIGEGEDAYNVVYYFNFIDKSK